MTKIEEIREQLAAKGINEKELDDNMIINLAKSFGMRNVRVPKAELIDYTSESGKQGIYIKTPGVEYVDGEGKKRSSKGCFIPVETIVQTIEDLQHGMEMAKEVELVK